MKCYFTVWEIPLWRSSYLHNGISNTGNLAYLHWTSPEDPTESHMLPWGPHMFPSDHWPVGLTYCRLIMPYSDVDLGQNSFSERHVAVNLLPGLTSSHRNWDPLTNITPYTTRYVRLLFSSFIFRAYRMRYICISILGLHKAKWSLCFHRTKAEY